MASWAIHLVLFFDIVATDIEAFVLACNQFEETTPVKLRAQRKQCWGDADSAVSVTSPCTEFYRRGFFKPRKIEHREKPSKLLSITITVRGRMWEAVEVEVGGSFQGSKDGRRQLIGWLLSGAPCVPLHYVTWCLLNKGPASGRICGGQTWLPVAIVFQAEGVSLCSILLALTFTVRGGTALVPVSMGKFPPRTAKVKLIVR